MGVDIIGKTFNSLTVIELYSGYYAGKTRRLIKANCLCGKIVTATREAILTGRTKSCGCIKLKFKEREKAKAMRTSFQAMKSRCRDEDGKWYKYYKAKGIMYCERWNSFRNFYDDMHETWQPGLELDRIENDKGYYKENCRWATHLQQQRNKTSNKLTEGDVLKIRDSKLSPQQLGNIYNVHYTTIARIKNRKRWA